MIVGAPTVNPNGVVNGASFSTEALVSPGSIASLFGTTLAAAAATATTIPLPTALGGAQVMVNGAAVPLFYVSPTQINFEMPPDLSGTTAQVVVASNGVSGPPATMNLAPAAVGIFTIGTGGSGQGAVLNQDSSVNSAQNPASVGSAISIYATGLGTTNPPAITGQPAGSSPLSVTVATPVVMIGGVPAEVLFSGLAPGFVGLYQVNVQIPAGVTTGPNVPLVLLQNGVPSNTVTLAIR